MFPSLAFASSSAAVIIVLGVCMLALHMSTLSRLSALEGKVDFLVELAVHQRPGEELPDDLQPGEGKMNDAPDRGHRRTGADP